MQLHLPHSFLKFRPYEKSKVKLAKSRKEVKPLQTDNLFTAGWGKPADMPEIGGWIILVNHTFAIH